LIIFRTFAHQTNNRKKRTEMEKVRFGVIGTNRITDWFLKGAGMDERFELTAVCSRSLGRAAAFAGKYNAPHAFASIEDLTRCHDVDAVYIATPNALHAQQSIYCMSHGKHVLCEKAFASNAREAAEMIGVARRHGVTLMEAMKTTLTPGFRRIIDNIGLTGTPRRYFASYCQYSSRYDSLKKGVMLNAFNPQLSNGAVMDIGVYTIYPMVVLFGRPDSIHARSIMLSTGVDGQGTAMFGYDGMDASVIYSKIADSLLPSEIQGESGTISISDIHVMDEVRFIPRDVKTPVMWSDGVLADEYYYEAAEFIDMVLSGRSESEINSHANSLTTMEILDEIRRQSGVRFPADR